MGNWEILSRSSLAPASVHASLSPLKREQSKNEFQFSKAGRNKGGKEGGREERFRCRKRTGGSWGPSSLCDWATRKVFEHLRWNRPTHALNTPETRVSPWPGVVWHLPAAHQRFPNAPSNATCVSALLGKQLAEACALNLGVLFRIPEGRRTLWESQGLRSLL